jgi:hypothetical protein
MIYIRNWRFSAAGDPYGNRTRVSAVKRLFAMESMARPAFPVLFLPLYNNGLRVRGDEIGDL